MLKVPYFQKMSVQRKSSDNNFSFQTQKKYIGWLRLNTNMAGEEVKVFHVRQHFCKNPVSRHHAHIRHNDLPLGEFQL